MTTRAAVERFLSHRHLALAGVSRSGKKFGNRVLQSLKEQGYCISLLHPEVAEIDGEACHRSVGDLPEGVGGMILVIPPEPAAILVREAVARGVRNIWLQQGSESAEAVAFCHENDVNVIAGECILMFARPTGIHRLHRWVRGLRGRLPRDAA